MEGLRLKTRAGQPVVGVYEPSEQFPYLCWRAYCYGCGVDWHAQERERPFMCPECERKLHWYCVGRAMSRVEPTKFVPRPWAHWAGR